MIAIACSTWATFAAALALSVHCVRAAFGDERRGHSAFRACAALLLSAGLVSTLATLRMLLVLGPARAVGFNLVVAIAMGAAALALRRRGASDAAARPRVPVTWLDGLFVVLAALSLLACLEHTWRTPDGQWDAWAIWTYRGRTLLRSGGRIDAATAGYPLTFLTVFHLDYPLGLPALLVEGWRATGGESTFIPAAVAVFFTTAMAAVLGTATSAMASRQAAMLVTALLFSTPNLVTSCWYKMADIPVGTFALLATALAATAVSTRRGLPLLLSGACAGFAAFTKNEGLLYLSAICVALLTAVRGGLWERWRHLLLFVTGAAPMLVLLRVYRSLNGVPAQQISSTLADTLHRLSDPGRYVLVGRALWGQALDFDAWGALLLALPPAIVALVAAGRFHGPARVPIVVAAVSAAGLALVYVTTPYDLAWQLSSSVDRLLMQLVPLFLLAVGIAVGAPRALPAGPPTSARPATA